MKCIGVCTRDPDIEKVALELRSTRRVLRPVMAYILTEHSDNVTLISDSPGRRPMGRYNYKSCRGIVNADTDQSSVAHGL